MKPEELEAVERGATPKPWYSINDITHLEPGYYESHTLEFYKDGDEAFLCTLRNLAPHLIALWKAAEAWTGQDGDTDANRQRVADAVNALGESA